MKKWIAKKNDGSIISEDMINWGHLNPSEINELSIDNNGQIISLPKNVEFIQGKTASSNLGTNQCEIESRYIGFKLRNNIVRIRINEKTNNISVEIE